MTDTRTPEQRHRIMKAVRTKDTGPELAVRRALFSQGFRYRLHARKLPGRPDVTLPGRKIAIFVHGCFWHGHSCAKGGLPKSRLDYWEPKIAANQLRDQKRSAELEGLGWRVVVIWECETREASSLREKVLAHVGDG